MFPDAALLLFPTTANCFDVYKQVNITQPSLATMGRQAFVDRIHATPTVHDHGHLSDVPAYFDMALIWTDDEKSNGAMKGTYLEGASDFILIFIWF